MTREQVREWLSGYEAAWRTAGTAPLYELFAVNATYQLSPYEDPIVGLEAIADMWDREREGPDETFTMASEVLAVEGDTAVARVEVTYGAPVKREYRDLWVMRFEQDGRCRTFEEWPFAPGQPRVAPGT